jgi:hypothetical protein
MFRNRYKFVVVLILLSLAVGPTSALWARTTSNKPQADFTATLTGPGNSSPGDHVCIGSEYTWSASASGGTSPYTYDFEFAGTYSASHSSTQSYTFSAEGWYRVNVDVYDATAARRTEFVYVYAENGGSCVLP